ncbi:MAG: restriction endonuclease subunit S [Alphaproteobacteria bacterium]|nr:restriction endonuclease subunit S [Alphaproteobacteria bacterium]
MVALGEVAEIDRSGIDPGKIEDGTAYLGLEHIESGGRIIGSEAVGPGDLKSMKFAFTPDHVLFGKLRPYLGKIALPEEPGICSTDIVPIKPGPKLDRAFLAYCLRQPQMVAKAAERATGANLPRLSPKELERLEIPLPPLDEQKRIAAILDKADALRRAREAKTDIYDDLSVSVFYDLFGDPFLNDRNWDDSVQLGAVSEIASGITKGRKTNGAELVETPYLAVSNVQDRRIDLSVVKTIAATETERARFKLRPDDLLLTEGGDPDKLGRGALWDGQISVCIHQNHVFRVRFDTAKVVPVFGMWLIGSVRGRRYFLKSAKQTTGIASINKTQLREFPMLCPPIELQQTFAERIARIVQARRRAEDALVKAQSLFTSLQHRAFAGEL